MKTDDHKMWRRVRGPVALITKNRLGTPPEYFLRTFCSRILLWFTAMNYKVSFIPSHQKVSDHGIYASSRKITRISYSWMSEGDLGFGLGHLKVQKILHTSTIWPLGSDVKCLVFPEQKMRALTIKKTEGDPQWSLQRGQLPDILHSWWIISWNAVLPLGVNW